MQVSEFPAIKSAHCPKSSEAHLMIPHEAKNDSIESHHSEIGVDEEIKAGFDNQYKASEVNLLHSTRRLIPTNETKD